MKNRRNYYRILHVQPDAPREIIKASYRTLMQKLKLHPDLGGDEWNAALLNEAYAVLSRPGKRAAYDRELAQSGKNLPPAGRQPPTHGAAVRAHTGRVEVTCPFCQTPDSRHSGYGGEWRCRQCQGPLRPVAQLKQVASTNRALQRQVLHARVRFYRRSHYTEPLTATVTDLSPQGLRLSSPYRLDKDEIIRISSADFSAIGRVIHRTESRTPGRNEVGIAFLTLEFHERRGNFVSNSA